MEVKVIRLVSGEEIISFVREDEHSYHLQNPCFIVPTEKGVGLMEVMPYTVISEKGTDIKKSSIVFITEPVSGLQEQFKRAHSKIDLPPEKKLII